VEIDEPQLPGTTPLDAEQLEGLKLAHVATLAERDAAEQDNIIRGQDWALRARMMRYPDLLTEGSVLRLHVHMFGNVYSWAGTLRTRIGWIGVEPHHIGPLLRQLCENARVWVERGTWSPEETAVRLHHELVRIHVFPNGNGRHARLMADLLLTRHYERAPLPWSNAKLSATKSGQHAAYIAAMRCADAGDFAPIIEFATAE
jgi:Fic-DOC domain mobile mystery protein B